MSLKVRRIYFLVLLVLLAVLTILHLGNGSFSLDFSDLSSSIFSFDENDKMQLIFREIRLPRTIIALLGGAALSVSGLLLQTYFNNPLAGPSVLGITSGSSLFVALSLLSGISFFTTEIGITMSAMLGAVVFSVIILFFSFFIRSQVSLLLVGMMMGAFTSAIIQVLEVTTNANQLKSFTLWSLGSLQQVSFEQLPFIVLIFGVGLASLILLIKPLNTLVIGEKQAVMLGMNLKQVRISVILVSSLFAGLITAFCGPISFIGLAVPNIVKQLFKTQNHSTLFLACILFGAVVLLLCDLAIILLEAHFAIPLNGITSLIGAPIVVWIILKQY